MVSVELLPAGTGLDQSTRLAIFGFLARYRGATLRAYRQDMKAFCGWCEQQGLQPLLARRAHLELYLRCMEERGYSPSTVGRRFTAVGGFYRYAVIDGYLTVDPTVAVTRPKVPWEGQRRSILHPLEFAALLTTARADGPHSHALVALLGMVGLRVGEACSVNVTDLHANSGYELLHVMGKGSKPATIPLPVMALSEVPQGCLAKVATSSGVEGSPSAVGADGLLEDVGAGVVAA